MERFGILFIITMKILLQLYPLLVRDYLRLVVEECMGIREVERSLGITFGVLKGWVPKHQAAAFIWRVAPDKREAELKRLRNENERLLR